MSAAMTSGDAKRPRGTPPTVSAFASTVADDAARGGPGTPDYASPGGAAPADDPMGADWAPRPVDKAAQRKRLQSTAPIVPAKRRSMTGGSRRASANGDSDASDPGAQKKAEALVEAAGAKLRYLSRVQENLDSVKEERKPAKEENHFAKAKAVPMEETSDGIDAGDPSISDDSVGDNNDSDDESEDDGDDQDGPEKSDSEADAGYKGAASLAQLAKAGNSLEARANEYKRVSKRPRLDDCDEESFEEDYVLFHKMTGRGAPLSRLGKANGIRLDLFNLYKQTCIYGGFVRTGNGQGINWAGQVFPNMKNFTHGNKATSIGNQLIMTYRKFLVEYEQANQQDLDANNCKLCGQEMAPDGLEQWVQCVKCEGWFHYCCVISVEEQKIRPKSIAAKIYSFKQYERQKGPDYTCSACLLGRQGVRPLPSIHHQPHPSALQRSSSLGHQSNPSMAPRNPASAPRPPTAASRNPAAAPRQSAAAPRTGIEAPRPREGSAQPTSASAQGAQRPSGAAQHTPAASSLQRSETVQPPASGSAASVLPRSESAPHAVKVSVKVKVKDKPLVKTRVSTPGGAGARPGGQAGGLGKGPGPDLATMQRTRALVKAALKEDDVFARLTSDGFDLAFTHFTSHGALSGSSRAIIRVEPRDKLGQITQEELVARSKKYLQDDKARQQFSESCDTLRESMKSAALRQLDESLRRIAERISKDAPGMVVRVREATEGSSVEAVVEAENRPSGGAASAAQGSQQAPAAKVPAPDTAAATTARD